MCSKDRFKLIFIIIFSVLICLPLKLKAATYNVQDWIYRVNTSTLSSTLNFRESANSGSKSIGTLMKWTSISSVLEEKSGPGCTDKWFKIVYNGKTGYVCSSYLIAKSSIIANDAEYANQLRNEGFPDSYIPYLTYIHNLHPNWIFKPSHTLLKWNNVIAGEKGQNATNLKIDAYRVSDKIVDGSSWYESTTGLDAFYLDPRNWLTERYIFMFEKLNYDTAYEDRYKDIVKSIFAGGTLATDTIAGYIKNSGKNNNINPIHLAARIKQEVSANGGKATSGASFVWEGKTYSGYYNFFNVGASDGENAVVRGLAFAAGLRDKKYTSDGKLTYKRPWNTPEKAIEGGAYFLSYGYISKGQHTLYYQKFNTSPISTHNAYTHQYMSNVHAPSSEASSTFNAYEKAALLGTDYTFEIPVYLEMPTLPISLPITGSTNNKLKNISINDNLINGFQSDVLSYTYYVTNETNSVNISAVKADETSTITGTGNKTLTANNQNFTLTVTSESGSVKNYNIEIIKVNDITSIDELVKNLNIKINNNFMSEISLNTTTSSLIENIQSKSPSAIITIKNLNGNVLSSNTKLSTGNTITINSTTNESKTFTIAVKGDTSGDGEISILDLLKIQKHLIGSNKLSGAYSLAADTNNDNNITILDLLKIQKYILNGKDL